MRPMKRKQIYLEAEQDRRLRSLARREGRTESALIREGVESVLRVPLPPALDHTAWEKELTFIDSLIRRGPIKGKRRWKREDLYERR